MSDPFSISFAISPAFSRSLPCSHFNFTRNSSGAAGLLAIARA
jgi:hypothetical protein